MTPGGQARGFMDRLFIGGGAVLVVLYEFTTSSDLTVRCDMNSASNMFVISLNSVLPTMLFLRIENPLHTPCDIKIIQ